MVAEENRTETATQAVRVFTGTHCEYISYSIKAKTSAVNLDAFLAAVENARGAHCAPKNEHSDFHLHLSWRTRRDTFSLDVEFVSGAIAKPPGDKEPFAEDFLTWVEKFFVTKTVDLRIDAEFAYLSSSRQSKFPLPLKASVGQDTELNIDGISFSLAGKPEGVAKLWITQGAEKLWIHTMAERSVELRAIDPTSDIAAFSRVVDTIIEERKQ